MPKSFNRMRVSGVTGSAVLAGTGKTWDEWYKALDRAGARMMDHKDTLRVLQEKMGLTLWWAKMITSGYEIARGLHQDGTENPAGEVCEIRVTKLIGAPPPAVGEAWQKPELLAQWLPGAQFEVTGATPPRALELNWTGETRVSVRFYRRHAQTKVVVSHRSLAPDELNDMQRYWDEALDRLKLLFGR